MNPTPSSLAARGCIAARAPLRLLAVLGLLLAACEPAAAPAGPPMALAPSARLFRLDPALTGWKSENRARIDALLAARGASSPGYDPAYRPVATFDWDNTMMRNDIGDATMAWILGHDGILQPPGRDWTVTSAVLTQAARDALHGACDAAGEPGRPLATREAPACADAIYDVYADGKTPAGAPGWTRQLTLTNDEADTWLARLLAGHTPAEVAAFARQAYDEGARAAVGASHVVGTRAGVTAYLRIYPEMKDLVRALKANGFDVWVVSASPQHVVEVVSAEVGIAADHTIGIGTKLEADGRLGVHLEPCGDGAPESVITYDEGKRCFINRVIFGQPPAAQLRKADAAHRQVFAAGDSDTDVAFVQDATDLKLVIDRHKPALMCNAWSNAGGKWLVQPMFFDPLPPRAAPYPCSTITDPDGKPIVDEDGRAMTDKAR
jgi:phosphoglycolate phosphatase-like HAD superfamily hydrolase